MFSDDIWFAGLKGAFKTPTWKSLYSSLVFVFFFYLFLYILATRFVDFEFHIPGFVVYSLGYVIAILFYFRLTNSYYRWNDGNKTLAYLKVYADSFSMKVSVYLIHRKKAQFLSNSRVRKNKLPLQARSINRHAVPGSYQAYR